MKPEQPLDFAKFRRSSRPQTEIRWFPVSGHRPSSLARSRHGFRSPASAGPIPARSFSGSHAADEQSDPELRSFRWVLRRRCEISACIFYICFALAEATKHRGSTLYSNFCLEFLCCCCYSAISACRRASVSPRPLGLAVAIPLSRLPPFEGCLRPLRPPPPYLL